MLRWLKSRLIQETPGAPSRTALGEGGENAAARFLRGLGYRIIERNFRCELGEVEAPDGRADAEGSRKLSDRERPLLK